MLGVKPYISFKGNCEEAINFYKEQLGAEVLYISRYGESPLAGKGPDEKIMHCSLKIGDSVIMACDNVFEDHNPTTVGNNITLALGTNDMAQADAMFDNMSEGGTIIMPMQETFWAQKFGMLTDKFGINWMFNVDKPEADHAQAGA
jgi:PhnB protein